MSETLKAPWIADYLINIAETYGSNLINVPVHIKPGRKVQLLRVSPIPRGAPTVSAFSYIKHRSSSLSNNIRRMIVYGHMSLTSINSYLCDSPDKH